MEIKVEEVAGYMDSLFKKQDFSTLADVSRQVTQQRPQIASAWRYAGIMTILNGEMESEVCNKQLF
jgi:hypothetical protein